MTLEQNPLSEAAGSASPSSPGRQRRSWLRAARLAWIVLALVLLATFVFNIFTLSQSLQRTVCITSTSGNCSTGQLNSGNIHALAQAHLSLAVYASFLVALTTAVSLLFWMVGLLIFWRKSQEWTGLFFSLVCVLIGTGGGGEFFATVQMPLLFQLLTTIINGVMYLTIVVFVFTFPTGRFTPRWTWVACILTCVLVALPPILPASAPLVVSALAAFLAIFALIGIQIYRYVRVYDAVQRQQTKWVVFGLSVGLSLALIWYILGAVVPGWSAPDSWYLLLENPMWLVVWAFLALGVGIAILRYRLWDIDVLINRTLVYGSLTALLVGLYVGLILALQALVGAVTGSLSQQPLVIVVSTLVIAALFQPLRRRIQNIIDRRFYRHKYDAAKVVAAFSATLRNEVDLDQLREQLIAVVQETMQPTHASLWLRQPTRTATPSLRAGKPSPEEAGVREGIAEHAV